MIRNTTITNCRQTTLHRDTDRATQQLRDTRKLRNELSLPHQDDCKTSIGHKVTHNKQNDNIIPRLVQQSKTNHNLRTDSSPSVWGIKCIFTGTKSSP